jgi:hypothetical protein
VVQEPEVPAMMVVVADVVMLPGPAGKPPLVHMQDKTVSQKVEMVVAQAVVVVATPAAMVDLFLVVIKLAMQVITDQTWEMLWPIPAVAPQGELVNLTTQDQWGMVVQTLKVALVVM